MGRRSTLERNVKKQVTGYLIGLKVNQRPVHWRMHVPGGYNAPGLDYEGCYAGRFFAIETKAPGEWLTPMQRDTAMSVIGSGGKVFIISSEEGLDAFRRWIASCSCNL